MYFGTLQQPYLLLKGIPIMIKLSSSTDTFRLMQADTENYKENIQAVKLWMCVVILTLHHTWRLADVYKLPQSNIPSQKTYLYDTYFDSNLTLFMGTGK